MPKRHNNTIRKLLFRSKTIKAILSSMTRIGPTIYIEDPEEALNVDHVHIEKDTEIKKITVADITTTSHPIRSNVISVINLNAN